MFYVLLKLWYDWNLWHCFNEGFKNSIQCATLDIAATLKNILDCGKRIDIWHLVLLEKKSCLKSRHLVLWSLGTLTGQQRFYSTGLVT